MSLCGKKLGLLLSTRPDQPAFQHGVQLAEQALANGVVVYLYCIDDAVFGIEDQQLQLMKQRGLYLYACAHAAQRRQIPISEAAVFSGLSVLSDLIAATDRFLSFN